MYNILLLDQFEDSLIYILTFSLSALKHNLRALVQPVLNVYLRAEISKAI